MTVRATKNIIDLKDHGLLFFISGKCGSRSVKQMVASMGYAKPHPKESQIMLPYLQPQQIPKDRFKIFIARNPWSRLCSMYKTKVYLRLTQRFSRLGFKRKMPFIDFVRKICRTTDQQISNIRNEGLFQAAAHYYSQTVFAIDKEGQWLPKAVVQLEKVDEQWPVLQEFMEHTFDVLLPPFPPNDRVDPEHDLDYRRLYCDATVAMVAKRYARDIELLDYNGPPEDYEWQKK